MRRVVWRSFLGLLIVLALLVIVLGALIGTQSGGRWLISQVPGLQIEDMQGTLGGTWQARQLRWEQGQTRVDLDNVQFSWRPACLLKGTLCIDTLTAASLAIETPPSSDSDSSKAVVLPDVALPVRVQIGDLQLERLLINQQEHASAMRLSGSLSGSLLQIDRLAVQRESLALQARGNVQLAGAWPLQLDGALRLPEVDEQPWNLQLKVNGELMNTLRLQGESDGYLASTLQGEVRALAADVPARLTLVSEQFNPARALPPTMHLQAVTLQADGNLSAGYVIEGTAQLAGDQQAMPVKLVGQVDAGGAQVEQLRIGQTPEQSLILAGSLDWREALAAQLKLDWQHFAWQQLLPDQDSPVDLEQLHAELDYQGGQYLGHFRGELSGPAGVFSVGSPFSGDLEQITLPQLELVAGQGRLDGLLKLGFAEGLQWQANLQTAQLDPGYWLAPLRGTLGGPMISQGQWREGVLSANADIDLQGRLRGQATQIQLKAQGQEQHWQLQRLLVALGNNRISADGVLDKTLKGQLQVQLNNLAQLWPGLKGQLTGQGQVAGSLGAPHGTLALAGQGLGLDETQLRQLQLDARLDATQQGQLQLQVRGLRHGETLLGRLQLQGQGNPNQQTASLSLDGPLLKLELAGDGRLQQGQWRGQLSRGEVDSGGQQWRLTQAAALQRTAKGRLTLGAHCWRAGDASLCGGEQQLAPSPKLDLTLSQFPLASLQPWLPQDFQWQGRLEGRLQVDLAGSGPEGVISLQTQAGEFRVREPEQDGWLDFPYQRLSVQATLRPQQVETQLVFMSSRSGSLNLSARIDPRRARKPITGDFEFSGFELDILRPFVPMAEVLKGRVQGRGSLGGLLDAPEVTGQLTLRDGEISGSELPTSLEQLQVTALIEGQQMRLDGSWRNGEQGRGSLDGHLNWASALDGQLHLTGQRLGVNVEPYARLEVEPDLTLTLDQGQMAVSGRVNIPRGAITVRELPPSTVKVSSDAKIVGEQPRVEDETTGLAMNVTVQVGQDALTFNGFGLRAELKGRVKITDNLDTRGEVELVKGRFQAYGQRLTIRRARLLFTGPIDQPFIDVEAFRRVDNVVAGIRLSGSAEQPHTTVFAEPAMSEAQALSYLVLGRPIGSTGEDSNLLGQAALAMGLAGGSSLTQGLAQSLGIKDFQLETAGSGLTTNVVASGQITERLSLRYGVGVFAPANSIALRYELSRRLFLEAVGGLSSSLDLFYERDF